MANIEQVKAAALNLFSSALPPGIPPLTQFATVEQITLPISNFGVINHGAMDIINSTFVPANSTTPDAWSTGSRYTDAYLTLIQNMAYAISTPDQNTVASLTTANQDSLNTLVNIYEQTYGRITDEQMTAAGVQTKIDYVTGKLPTLKSSLNWAKFQPTYNSAVADMDILANINSNKVTFGAQVTAIKTHLSTPSATNGGTQTFDANNNKVWAPGYNVDPNFPSKLANGQTVTINIQLTNVGTDQSSVSINGNACGGFPVEWLYVSGSTSAEYSQADFKLLMSNVTIQLTYKNVCFLTASPSSLSTDNRTGWFAPGLLKLAYNGSATNTGPYFSSAADTCKAALQSGSMKSLIGLLVSTAASGTMTFASGSYEAFSRYFHTESHASVNLFGFIPIATANTSYSKASSGSSSSSSGFSVVLNNSQDTNNLVIHGGVLENPIA